MLLHKLVYIAHGWNLAINGVPLIAERPEAWDNGPVYRSLWDHIRNFGYRGRHNTLVDPISGEEIRESLTDEEASVIQHVWRKYGKYSATELSKMTHEANTPWFKAYFSRGRNSSLNNEEIRAHYIKLALAGREQRT